jgi:predicted DNA-binding antitoxin AbrB/MazE fold protein
MAQVTEAVFRGGVLKPVEDLALREDQRVRLIIEPLEEPQRDRASALKKFLAGIEGMQFFSTGKLPSRDELHDRV